MHFLGYPVFGFWLPYIGPRSVPLNRDYSVVDTGEADITDEVGVMFVRLFAVEWLGYGHSLPFGQRGFDTATGERLW